MSLFRCRVAVTCEIDVVPGEGGLREPPHLRRRALTQGDGMLIHIGIRSKYMEACGVNLFAMHVAPLIPQRFVRSLEQETVTTR